MKRQMFIVVIVIALLLVGGGEAHAQLQQTGGSTSSGGGGSVQIDQTGSHNDVDVVTLPAVTFGGTAQPVTISSGTVTFSNATIGISGTVSLAAETTKIIGTVNIAAAQSMAISGSVAVTGTFWQSTQPVSIASMPSTPVTNANLDAALSTLATAAKQPTLVSGRTPVDPSGVTSPVSLASLPALAAGAALVGKFGIDQTTPGTTNKVTVGSDVVAVTGPLTDTQLRATPVPVSGTVTVNAGTNLNTSALAVESGGNLASIKADVDKIPSQGQALAGASMPVVLPAAQVTTLTPPAAITGFALESTQLTGNTSLASVKTNTDPLVTSGAGAYMRQDSTATMAKESGGNLATIAGKDFATAANQTTELASLATAAAATHLEDAAASDGDRGVAMLAVRADSAGSLVNASGDYEMFQLFQGWLRSLSAGLDRAGNAQPLPLTAGGGALPVETRQAPSLPFPYRCNALRRTQCQ